MSVQFASAGVPGLPGRDMDPEMAIQLRQRGGVADGHESRSVSVAALSEADVVVTVQLAHRLRIAQTWPEHAAKVFGLHQLAEALDRSATSVGGLVALDGALATANPDSLTWEVADPYRRGAAAARACAEEIDEALAVIVPALIGTSAQTTPR